MVSQPTSDVLLETDNLTVTFDDYEAVSGASFSIYHNEILGLVGETKAGKSVLARAIIDSIPFPGRITKGDIRFCGRSILQMNPDEKRERRGGRISLIGTNPKALLNPVERVGNQIAAVLLAHQKVDPKKAWQAAVQLFHDVGIVDPDLRAKSYPHELSGGMAQRGVIAMALVSNPDLVLADDATLGLDATVQVQVLDLLIDQSRKRGLSVLLITHDLGIVSNYCNRVAIMSAGKIVEVARVSRFLEGPEQRYSQELLAAAEVCPSIESAACEVSRSSPKDGLMDPKPLLEAENLVKYFPVGRGKVVKAVDGVSFHIMRGETLALVGESGSGKTTVGQCLVRLLRQTSGLIRFDGQVISNMNDGEFRKLRSRMQMVFQESYVALNPRWRIQDLISEPLKLLNQTSEKEKQERVHKLLSMVHVNPTLASAYPHQLTAGEQKRVGIARGLATNPDFVIFDESTTGLDIRVRAQIIALIRELQDKTGITALFITHDLNSVRYLAHRVAVMWQGLIVETGRTDEIFANPHEDYTKTLIAAELPIRQGASVGPGVSVSASV